MPKLIILSFIILNLFSTCRNEKSVDRHDNNILTKEINPSSDSIVSIFSTMWPNIDSLSEKLLKNLTATVIVASYEDEPNEICRYYLDTIKYTLRREFQSGGVSVSELRILFLDNTIKILSSDFSGTTSFTNQNNIEIYDYDYNKMSFLLDSVNTSFFSVDLKDYFKENTPDSVVLEFESHSSHFFQIVYIEAGIAENKLFDESFDKEITNNNWLKGNIITYYYENNKFRKSGPYFTNN